MTLRAVRPVVCLFASLFLLATLNLRASEENETWIEVRTPHFVVASNAGGKQARRVADQFEQIRAMFHTTFPKLRVDPGQRILILAAKNENSFKALLPEYWEVKGRVHPSGIYVAGPEKHYVALRLDAEEENPFHSVYHEYTHALVNLNFRGLPLWLNEGLAEFYGNTVLGEKEVLLGHFDTSHLLLLQQSKLIPIPTLLEVDHTSPYYNEENRASVFYAESWALTHYLMLDPEARKQQLMSHFLDTFQKGSNQVEAARQTFGDLKKFAGQMEGYVRQTSFYLARLKAPMQLTEKDYATRTLSAAESLALRGDFHLHMNRMSEARTMLEQALALEPKLAAVHESLGYYHYRQQNLDEASREFAEAVKLDSKDYLAHYFHAFLRVRGRMVQPDELEETRAGLEKAIQLNPEFAPAYASLSSLYLSRSETKQKALDAALRAAQLAPGELQYALNLGQVLVALNRQAEARSLAKQMQAAAKTPEEARMAQALEMEIDQRERFANLQRAEPEEGEEEEASPTGAQHVTAEEVTAPTNAERTEKTPVSRTSPPKIDAAPPPEAPKPSRPYSMMGRIVELDCSMAREATLTLTMSGITMRLHAADVTKVEYQVAEKPSTAAANPCAQWKGRQAKISYALTPGKQYDGEITAIYFF
jgi:tetratricopeptide (TPR) repeat protein